MKKIRALSGGVAMFTAMAIAGCGGGGASGLGSIGAGGTQTLSLASGNSNVTGNGTGTTTGTGSGSTSNTNTNTGTGTSTGAGNGAGSGSDNGTEADLTGPGTGAGTGTVPVTTGLTPYRNFALAWSHAEIFALADANPAAGSAVAWRMINLTPELLASLHHTASGNLHYDAGNDRLYVAFGGGVLVFDQASTSAGSLPPARVITPAGSYAGTSGFTGSMQFDAATDTIWLPEDGADGNEYLLQISNASSANGTVTPTNEYAVPVGENGRFVIDSQRSLLYVANGATIMRFEMNLLQAGPLAPGHTVNQGGTSFTIPGTSPFDNGDGLAIDSAQDRLFHADAFNGLHIIDGASTATSATLALTTIPLTNPVSATYDAANDRLWVGGSASNAWVFNNASTINAATPVPAPVTFGPALPAPDPNDTTKDVVLMTGFAFP